MKATKKLISILLCVVFIVLCFAGCSGKDSEKYNDETLIIGYTESAAPFLEVNEEGKASGFYAELWKKIFDNIKGELKGYVFEKVDEGYTLEESGGFLDSASKEYSAGLLMGAVSKNRDTFNEDYSFTEPIITNRVITITNKGSKIKAYTDFAGAKVVTYGSNAKAAFEKHSAISKSAASVAEVNSMDEALAKIDDGSADAVVTEELYYMPNDKAENYAVLEKELDTIEYVIACAKHSGWKDSINEAIRQLKDKKYTESGKDEFTPIVQKYFGYNASKFKYEPQND